MSVVVVMVVGGGGGDVAPVTNHVIKFLGSFPMP
jgi:hypothetical protein